MASLLKELSLAIGLLSSDDAQVALKEGWQGYVWRVRPVEHCAAPDERGFCTLLESRWDWKRDQHYVFAVKMDGEENRIETRVLIDNRDPDDDDHVCIAAVFYDREDREVAVDFRHIYSVPGQKTGGEAVLMPMRPLKEATRVAIGSKQCDAAAEEDAALFASVRDKLGQK